MDSSSQVSFFCNTAQRDPRDGRIKRSAPPWLESYKHQCVRTLRKQFSECRFQRKIDRVVSRIDLFLVGFVYVFISLNCIHIQNLNLIYTRNNAESVIQKVWLSMWNKCIHMYMFVCGDIHVCVQTYMYIIQFNMIVIDT